MPREIIPVHQLDQHKEIFEPPYLDSTGLSALQLQFMGIQKSAAKVTFSEHVLRLLDEITQHEDEVLTAATVLAYTGKEKRKAEVVFRVPATIPDYDLLALKTQGLIQGKDRAVKLTELGRVALRDYWLKSSNAFMETRKKTQFELERIAGVATNESQVIKKFSRVPKEG